MAFENVDQAAEALAAAVTAPEGSAPVEAAPVQTEAPPNANQPYVEPTTEAPQSVEQESPETQESLLASRDIDLSGLSDDQREWLSAREREMQAVMTQRTQEAAEARQQAEQATQFIQELNTNPYFAAQVVQELSGQLEAAGFTPAQAQAEAQRQVGAQQTPQTNDFGFEEGFDDDPYLAEINQLREQQERMSAYLTQQQEASRVASLEAQLNNAAAYVQTQNPDFSDGDMSKIVNMAYAYNGDIVRAAEDYKAIRDSAVQDWISKKGSVQAPGTVPSGASAQAPPQKFESLEDPRLEQAAVARLNAVLGNS
jgi:hypothetical protein